MKRVLSGIVIAAVVVVVALWLSSTRDTKTAETETANIIKPIDNTMAGELKIEDVTVGTGTEAVAGKMVTVHYVGTFTSGEKFDSSRDRGTPFTFPLGAGRVIKGWDEGVVGMKVGGVRKLSIPPQLGYGPNDYGPIPGNSTLLFEVELIDVK